MRRSRRDDFSRRLVRESRLAAGGPHPSGVRSRGPQASSKPVPSMPERLAAQHRQAAEGRGASAHVGHSRNRAVPGHRSRRLKTAGAEEASTRRGSCQRCVREVKKRFPEMGVITDIALDPYTVHGQDGLDRRGRLRGQRRDPRRAGQAGALARGGRRGHRGALGHDGRSHRRHPSRARCAQVHPRAHPRATRRNTPPPSTGRSAMPWAPARASARATRRPTRWTRATRTRRCTRWRSTSTRAPIT